MTFRIQTISKTAALAALLTTPAGVVLVPQPAAAQMAVFDSAAVANQATQITHMTNQLSQLKSTYDQITSQLQQAKQQYESMTGARGFGDQINNPQLRKYLPADYKKVYDLAQGGGYKGISGTIDTVLAAEKLTGTVAEQMAAIRSRQTRSLATNKLIADDGFAGAEARLDQLEQLRQQISQTQDAKGVAELQARIAVEQAAIAGEATKLQLLALMAQAEEKLAAEQVREWNRKVLNPNNTGMFRIK
ncbi:MAG: P-type DNA transfer protein VirB5 [Rubrivivax sp.]|mgnify:CR=1 FL=1|nr:P-type DNA transfer protein VirB5 [Rubrivivax sp.]MDZ4053245.1 P-type DNA transfer protein VirB5 [Phenylobacterium sp.]